MSQVFKSCMYDCIHVLSPFSVALCLVAFLGWAGCLQCDVMLRRERATVAWCELKRQSGQPQICTSLEHSIQEYR